MFYATNEQYQDASTAESGLEEHSNRLSRSIKAVKSTRTRLTPTISVANMQDDHDYDEPSCPSFDLHLYAHIDHSSLNRCVFTPVPHQTVAQEGQSQPIQRKRKFDSIDAASNLTKKTTNFGHDNGELAEIIYNMDLRLDELTRTCNGLRSSIHNLTKMVAQLVHHQVQNTNTNELDNASESGMPYLRSSTSVTSKSPSSNRSKRLRSNPPDTYGPRPTEFLCRLIRKVYSTNEIVDGINQDERLDRIKEAVAERYFADEPDRFETFWAREAHQSILGQARAQRCRDKKARGYVEET